MDKLVYTAFDGDDMLYIDVMREYLIRIDLVPINPEHAFGYYVATTTHQDSKKEVMRDCFALAGLCDEFWVFTSHDLNNVSNLKLLPEGILSEMLMWCKKYNPLIHKSRKIRFINTYDVIDYLKDERNGDASKIRTQVASVCDAELEAILDFDQFEELSLFVEESKNLRESVFIEIEDKNYKYIDWVRIAAYKEGLVPIVPQCIIPEVTFILNNKGGEYQKASDLLRSRTAHTWIVVESRKKKLTHGNVKLLKDLGLPKFRDIDEWAITTKEKIENLNLLNA